MTMKSIQLFTTALCAVLLLGGCSGQVGLKALDRAPTAEDVLPAGVAFPEGPQSPNPDSVRLLAANDGVQYYAAENDDATVACIAVVPPGDMPPWIVGCGSSNSSGQIIEVGGPGGRWSATLVRDDYDTRKLESSGWTRLTDNLLITGS
ncbi:hypothetical protein [Arthrobacter sp. 35W]|uniref:hypothetical protein n=1 Tax=Arthrobacter sp. 35W TaxID=1132441 RepID=UPI00041030A0|nr:hypothetical protein [Arthrobacter sp. 35W]